MGWSAAVGELISYLWPVEIAGVNVVHSRGQAHYLELKNS
jgi:hypothetical protein